MLPSQLTAPSSGFTNFALNEIRIAASRARLLAVEIESAGAALAGGLIDAEEAVRWVAESGGIGLIASTIIPASS